jgi:glycerol-3-phosphate dehydrogenase (NAD(P)+)
MTTIGVIGAGAWGTALAQVQARNGKETLIWAREPEVVEAINTKHENTVFLPDVPLSPNLKATNDLAEIAKKDILLLVTPAQYMRANLKDLKPHLSPEQIIVICSKGIELQSGKLLTTVAKEELPKQPITVLTGPTFAIEIASGLPGAVTIGTEDEALGRTVQEAVGQKFFRPYISTDLIGVQLGGAIKNVMAIAAGAVTGRKLGESAQASSHAALPKSHAFASQWAASAILCLACAASAI